MNLIFNKIMRIIPDKLYIKIMYYKHFGKLPNINKPVTFSEKIQWLKLYDRNPLYTVLSDKYLVKEYVADKIGKEYIIPTIGVWDDPDEIDDRKLPDKFVLKWNHDSGSIYICKDKQSFDFEEVKSKLKKRKSHNGFWYGREWPYKNIPPKVIAETYMEDKETGELRDYKFFCFNGGVKALFIATNRMSKSKPTTFDFFDAEFEHLDIRQGHPNSAEPLKKPENFLLMKRLAEELSQNIPHVRVDFYEINGKVFFGEMTFYSYSGFQPFDPICWDEIIGGWLELPIKD